LQGGSVWRKRLTLDLWKSRLFEFVRRVMMAPSLVDEGVFEKKSGIRVFRPKVRQSEDAAG
jgi:hypothetical protein